MAEPIKYAAPRRGSEACRTLSLNLASLSMLLVFPGRSAMPPTPPKMDPSRTPKTIKKIISKKEAFLS